MTSAFRVPIKLSFNMIEIISVDSVINASMQKYPPIHQHQQQHTQHQENTTKNKTKKNSRKKKSDKNLNDNNNVKQG